MKNIQKVLKRNNCCGCGTCSSSCKREAISMVMNDRKGMILPTIDKSKCTNCGICEKCCPGSKIDFVELEKSIFNASCNGLEGIVKNTYLGNSKNEEIQLNSASGGIITSLLIFALSQGLIDGVLVVKNEFGLNPSGSIALTEDEIKSNSGSAYFQVPLNDALKDVLKRNLRVAVVGLPCHIAGIRKYESINSQLNKLIVYKFGLVCNHSPSLKIKDFYSYYFQKKCEWISKRKSIWPGEITLKFSDKSENTIQYLNKLAWGKLYNYFFWPRRCMNCFDKINRLSDISFMDPYNINNNKHDLGKTLFCTRSEKADELVKKAIGHGSLLAYTVDKIELEKSQNLCLSFRRFMARKILNRYSNINKHPSISKFYLPGARIFTFEVRRKIFNFIGYRRYSFVKWIIER